MIVPNKHKIKRWQASLSKQLKNCLEMTMQFSASTSGSHPKCLLLSSYLVASQNDPERTLKFPHVYRIFFITVLQFPEKKIDFFKAEEVYCSSTFQSDKNFCPRFAEIHQINLNILLQKIPNTMANF